MNIHKKREEGQGLVEYALVLVLVAIVIIVILTLMGRQVSGVYARLMAGFNGQVISGQGDEYAFVSLGINSPGGDGICTLLASATVVALKDGVPVSNVPVSVSVSAGGGTGSLAGTTNANGIVSMTSGAFNGLCSGTATFSGSGSSATKRY
jgi:pilus assembly protein Flp/PilA